MSYFIFWLKSFIKWLLAKKIRVVGLFLILILIGFLTFKIVQTSNQQVQIQTSTVELGSLITSVSASGSISSSNNTSITTGASGTISQVYVSNGDIVTKGQKIAELDLDEEGLEKQSEAYVRYLEAGEGVKTAQKSQIDADIEMWQTQQQILDAEENIDYKNINSINPNTKNEYTQSEKAIIDKSLSQAQAAFETAELKYKNATADISNAQIKKTAAWRDYQEVSAVIYAPASGEIQNLTLSPGVIITQKDDESDSSDSDVFSISSQDIGTISNSKAQLQAEVSLSELDVINVKANQKVTLSLDAYPNVTLTGKILAVDTNGNSNQGVTIYSAIILIDDTDLDIYPNMAISAEIILDAKTNTLLIPSTAIHNSDQSSYVELMNEDGSTTQITVEIGDSNDSQTEILSGLSEGDKIVTSRIDLTQNVEFGEQNSFGSGPGGMGAGQIMGR